MHEMTKEFLKAAFAGESQAHMKYLLFAEKAEQEGYPNIARLFRAIAYAEQVHAFNHLNALGMLGNTVANLETGIQGETFEVQEMYPAYKAVAELQDEKKAVRSTSWALEAEKIHAELYTAAKEKAASGKDIDLGTVYICPVCGYTTVDHVPDKCPLCNVPREKFKRF
jgi:rubrerythrin